MSVVRCWPTFVEWLWDGRLRSGRYGNSSSAADPVAIKVITHRIREREILLIRVLFLLAPLHAGRTHRRKLTDTSSFKADLLDHTAPQCLPGWPPALTRQGCASAAVRCSAPIERIRRKGRSVGGRPRLYDGPKCAKETCCGLVRLDGSRPRQIRCCSANWTLVRSRIQNRQKRKSGGERVPANEL
jgi:hypothetical protein